MPKSLATICVLAMCAASCSTPAAVDHPVAVEHTVLTPAEEAAVAHAYAERLRLGLGSPYRLIEAVLRDARLGSVRSAIAEQLLAQIESGRLYDVSPLVFVAAGADRTSALAQLELIRETIERAPRAGELAVDLAYQRLAADSVVSPAMAGTAAQVAALLRDRALAVSDVARLQRAAAQLHVRPRDLILRWRHERRFAVEQPTLAALDARTQAQAGQLAQLIRGGIEAALQPVNSELARPLPRNVPAMTRADAERVLEMALRAQRPPQNALVITLRALTKGAVHTRATLNEPHWQDALRQGGDEEALAAALLQARRDSSDDRTAARVALDAAVALRPFAQERFASNDTVTRAKLQQTFGVRVTMDNRIPFAARQATLDQLYAALEDLELVLPGLNLTGLMFDVQPISPTARYQAYHDPAQRVIGIDPSTAAGTLAHEIGHDVDWQIARARYGTTSSYATDFSVRKRKALRYLVAALEPDDRPAETFARRFEWYLAAALAQQGRSNGYLSSVQNEFITGYGSAIPPGAAPLARNAFMRLLKEGTGADLPPLGAPATSDFLTDIGDVLPQMHGDRTGKLFGFN